MSPFVMSLALYRSVGSIDLGFLLFNQESRSWSVMPQNIFWIAQRAIFKRKASAPNAAFQLVAQLKEARDPLIQMRPPSFT